MTRAELGKITMQEFAERRGHADRDWIATLLDRAIAVGREEICAHVERFGIDRGDSNVDNYNDHQRMRDHMPIVV
jgi:hypothetical protein